MLSYLDNFIKGNPQSSGFTLEITSVLFLTLVNYYTEMLLTFEKPTAQEKKRLHLVLALQFTVLTMTVVEAMVFQLKTEMTVSVLASVFAGANLLAIVQDILISCIDYEYLGQKSTVFDLINVRTAAKSLGQMYLFIRLIAMKDALLSFKQELGPKCQCDVHMFWLITLFLCHIMYYKIYQLVSLPSESQSNTPEMFNLAKHIKELQSVLGFPILLHRGAKAKKQTPRFTADSVASTNSEVKILSELDSPHY